MTFRHAAHSPRSENLQIWVKCEVMHLSSCHFSPARISRIDNIRISLLTDTPLHRMRDREPHVTASKRDEGQKIRRSPPAQRRARNEVTAAVTRRSQPVMVWPPQLARLQLTQILLSFLVATQHIRFVYGQGQLAHLSAKTHFAMTLPNSTYPG